MRQKGFTITELLVVIGVIVILAAIVIAAYSTAQNNGYDAAVRSDLDAAQGLFESFRISSSSTNTFPQNTTDLAALKLQSSRTSYNQLVSHNYIYCVNSTTHLTYDIVVLSKSGNIFIQTQDGLINNTYGFTSYSFSGPTTMCTTLGASYVASGMSSAGTWSSWMGT